MIGVVSSNAPEWLLVESDVAFVGVECCSSCATESKELHLLLLLAFALSGELTLGTFCSILLQKHYFLLYVFAMTLSSQDIHKKVNV